MTKLETKPLNRVEIWIAEHWAPIFAVLSVLIILGTIAVFVTWRQQSGTADTVKVIQPQVTHISQAICDKHSLGHPERARRCAERIRVGLINCRRSQPCRAAYLALATYPPPARSEGGDAQTPSTAGQQPSPGHQPGHPGGRHKPPRSTPKPAPTPVAPAPTAPPPPEPSPGNSGDSPGGDNGTKACVHIVVSACVQAGTNGNQKGLLP